MGALKSQHLLLAYYCKVNGRDAAVDVCMRVLGTKEMEQFTKKETEGSNWMDQSSDRDI